jgi:FG-GAP-like repeat
MNTKKTGYAPLGAIALVASLGACTVKQSEPEQPSGPYRHAPTLSTGKSPSALALADYDGDGALDLLVSNYDSGSLSRFRGNAKGGFASLGEIAAGTEPRSITHGDFDADGDEDVAVCNSADATLGVYLNDGEGTFGDPTLLTTGAGPTFVRARDLNQDSRVDLIVTNADGDSISVFLADGQGGFAAGNELPAGTNPVSATLVDLNDDGFVDVVTATRVVPPTVAVLLGDGQGSFGAPTKYKASDRPGVIFPIAPAVVAAGDVNGDGKVDVVVGNRGLDVLDGEVWLLAGDGSGVLAGPAEIPGVTVLAPAFIDLVDMDGDGTLDVIEADHDPTIAAIVGSLGGNSYSVCIHVNDGLGTFQPMTCLATGDYPYDVATGDLDTNSKLDVVTADSGSDGASVYLAR